MDRLSYSVAETRYKTGFKLTDEERLRRACFELINKSDSESGEDEDDEPKSSWDPSESGLVSIDGAPTPTTTTATTRCDTDGSESLVDLDLGGF